MLDLEPIKARYNATTGDEWITGEDDPDGREVVAVWDGNYEYVGEIYTVDNLAFVCAAKQDIPLLIEEVEHLRARVEYLELHHIPQIAPAEYPKYYAIRLTGDTGE